MHLTAHVAGRRRRRSGADFFACSPYKFLGPHCGVLAAAPELLETLHPDKLLPSTDAVPERFELGHAALRADGRHDRRRRLPRRPGARRRRGRGSRRERVLASMAALEEHEDRLRDRLEEGLATLPGVTLHSRAARRTPTLLLTFAGHDAAATSGVPGRARRQRAGRLFYAYEASRRLGLGDDGGLRVGLAPYTDDADVDRLLSGLGVYFGHLSGRTHAYPHGPSTSGSTPEPVSTSVPRTAQRHLVPGHVGDAEQLVAVPLPAAHREDPVVEALDLLGAERRERLVPAAYVEQVAAARSNTAAAPRVVAQLGVEPVGVEHGAVDAAVDPAGHHALEVGRRARPASGSRRPARRGRRTGCCARPGPWRRATAGSRASSGVHSASR